MKPLTILIATHNPPEVLINLLTTLVTQTFLDFDLIISDQSNGSTLIADEKFLLLRRIFLEENIQTIYHPLPYLTFAQQHQFLLRRVTTPYVLWLDADLLLENFVTRLLLEVMEKEQCGFVGSAPIDLHYLDDIRPDEEDIERWDNSATSEQRKGNLLPTQQMILHQAANIYHVQEKLGATILRPFLYNVTWIGGCVLFDRKKLLSTGCFTSRRDLSKAQYPEDSFIQYRVKSKYGGCGVLPSGVYKQPFSPTISHRFFSASKLFL